MTRALSTASLAAEHPEWRAWLALYDVARAAIDDPTWRDAVPAVPGAPDGGFPVIDQTTFAIDTRRAARLLNALLDRAGTSSVSERAVPAVFEAAIAEDGDRLQTLALEAGADVERFATAAALAITPLLQRCREAWQVRVPAHYMAAACPLCGAWAALAEARGLERQLRLRCGRCGGDWAAEVVRCAFCATKEHAQLGALVGETAGDTRRVDTCSACRAYMKTITTLTPCPPADVRLHDLATVDLDVAALSQGYARPDGPARLLEVRVTEPRRGAFARWRR
jgi:FdhE protein